MAFFSELSSLEVWCSVTILFLMVPVILGDVFFLWLSAAAAAVSVLLFLFPLPWQLQLLFFSLMVILFLGLSRVFVRRSSHAVVSTLSTSLNQRGSDLIGKEFMLRHLSKSGLSQVELMGVIWTFDSSGFKEGSRVRVVSVDGAVLKIENV